VRAKPDPKAVRRATAQVAAEHDWQTAWPDRGIERISKREERDYADAARRRNGQATRADLKKAIANMAAELEFVEAHLGRECPGDHRDAIRFARRAIQKLSRPLT
jgi:hypothetical protein